MTLDIRTEADRRYDAARDGSAYVKAASFEPSTSPRSRDNVLIGHTDGCEVRAHYMADDCDEGNGGLAWAEVVWNGLTISTDGCSYLNLPTSGGMSGDMEPLEWLAVKTLAQTDVPERLMALARRYPRFADVPVAPVAPVGTPVEAVRFVCDDTLDRRHGQEIGTDYRCGETVSYCPDDGSRPTLCAFGNDIFNDQLDRDLDNLITLLNDPRVQAARAAQR
jgi:hypothetical protein